MKKIFIICPVRNATEEVNNQIESYIQVLEKEGNSVYWPTRDTNQRDANGFMICADNCKAITEADEIHIWYDPNSTGTLFDMGMAFVLLKRIVLINKVEMTDGKSFANMLRRWEVVSKPIWEGKH